MKKRRGESPFVDEEGWLSSVSSSDSLKSSDNASYAMSSAAAIVSFLVWTAIAMRVVIAV